MDRAENEGREPTEADRGRLENIIAYVVVVTCSIVLVCKEFAVPLEESSRGVILEMLRVGSLSTNYPLFGRILQLATNLFGRDRLVLEVLAHAIFLSSALAWIAILLKLLQGRDRAQALVAMLIAIMLVNPVMIRFDLFAWRQSLSLAFFIYATVVAGNIWVKTLCIAISLIIHQGIIPVILLFAIFSVMPARILWISVPLSLVVMAILRAAFPFQFLPAWMPFSLQLTDLQALSAADPAFNNAPGAFVAKYIATVMLPVAALLLTGLRAETRWVRLAMALSLPLVIGNFIPGANRLLYYSVISAVICVPVLFAEFMGRKRGWEVYWGVMPALAMNAIVLLTIQS